MKGLDEAIRRAGSIEDLFQILDQMSGEIERALASEKSVSEALQRLARCLTDIRLTMNELVHQEVWVRDIEGAPASEAVRAARHLELGGRYEAVRRQLEASMRRIKLMPDAKDKKNSGLQPAGREKTE